MIYKLQMIKLNFCSVIKVKVVWRCMPEGEAKCSGRTLLVKPLTNHSEYDTNNDLRDIL